MAPRTQFDRNRNSIIEVLQDRADFGDKDPAFTLEFVARHLFEMWLANARDPSTDAGLLTAVEYATIETGLRGVLRDVRAEYPDLVPAIIAGEEGLFWQLRWIRGFDVGDDRTWPTEQIAKGDWFDEHRCSVRADKTELMRHKVAAASFERDVQRSTLAALKEPFIRTVFDDPAASDEDKCDVAHFVMEVASPQTEYIEPAEAEAFVAALDRGDLVACAQLAMWKASMASWIELEQSNAKDAAEAAA